MRLYVNITSFRSLRYVQVPLEGLVVLFGPNSAGKSTVLEAVQSILTFDPEMRHDPGDLHDSFPEGEIWFELPYPRLNDDDAALQRDLLSGLYRTDGNPWEDVEPDATDLLSDRTLPELTTFLIQALVMQGNAGSSEQREVIAKACFDSGLYRDDGTGVVLCLAPDPPGSPLMNAAESISAFEPGPEDVLGSVARSLHEGNVAEIALVCDETHPITFPVVTLDADTDRLAAEVESALPGIHDRLWGEVMPPPTLVWGLPIQPIDDFTMAYGGESGKLAIDPWIESLVDRGTDIQIATPDMSQAWDTGEWHRVRRTLIATAQVVSGLANELAPSFIKDFGEINVELLPISVWGTSPARVRITIQEHGHTRRDIGVVGTGTARWVAAAVRLACQRLSTGIQRVKDESGQIVREPERCNMLIQSARQDPFGQTTLELAPSDNVPSVYLVDEPEAHLHPLAARSVASWLTDLSATAVSVIVATHSPVFLEPQIGSAQLILVTKTGEDTELRPVEGAALQELAEIKNEMGLSNGDLLLLTRLILLVEGEHDLTILTEWFGPEFSTAGILIVPLRGVKNLVGLPQSEIVQKLGLPIAVLADDTDLALVQNGRSGTWGEIAVRDFLKDAKAHNIRVHPIGLKKKDIIDYLDYTVCQKVAPDFPGWHVARQEAHRHNKRKSSEVKKWIKDTYGLHLNTDSIRELAQQCKEADLIPNELRNVKKQILSIASGEWTS